MSGSTPPQRLLARPPADGAVAEDLAANAAAIVGIQRGLQGMYAGTGDDAEDAFASLERELGIQGI